MVSGVMAVNNPRLRAVFDDTRNKLIAQARSDPEIRTNQIALYHASWPHNIPSICRNNLLLEHAGATDAGWFVRGLYLSAYPDYCMTYHSTGLREVSSSSVLPGMNGRLLLFRAVPGRYLERCPEEGQELPHGYDSTQSPKGMEWVFRSCDLIYPSHIIDFDVVQPDGAVLGKNFFEARRR